MTSDPVFPRVNYSPEVTTCLACGKGAYRRRWGVDRPWLHSQMPAEGEHHNVEPDLTAVRVVGAEGRIG